MMMRLIEWLHYQLFARWFRVTITDPEEIARIKEEFNIPPLPPKVGGR